MREIARRNLAAALHVEVMRRITALLLIARDVVRGQARRRGRALRVERRAPDEPQAQLVSVAEETRRHRHLRAQLCDRVVATIGEHRVRFGNDCRGSGFIAAFPPHHGQAVRERRMHFGQQAREQGGEHRLRARQLADIAGLHQQAAHQAP
jgi:hypothetical protein